MKERRINNYCQGSKPGYAVDQKTLAWLTIASIKNKYFFLTLRFGNNY